MGAKQGRTKGNEQKSEYLEPDGMHGKPGRKEGEEQKSESESEKLWKQLRGGNSGKKEKKSRS